MEVSSNFLMTAQLKQEDCCQHRKGEIKAISHMGSLTEELKEFNDSSKISFKGSKNSSNFVRQANSLMLL